MESFRPQKSPGSDRFLGLFSSSPPSSTAAAAAAASFELDEHDIFSTDTIPNPNQIHTSVHLHSHLNPNSSPNSSRSHLSPFHRERNFGILAALTEEFPESRNPKFIQRKPAISAESSSASTSPSSAARMIPVIPKPKVPEYGAKTGYHQYQSAPMNVPAVPARLRGGPAERDDGVDDDDEDEMMLPPHEIVDRAHGKDEPLTTFSVLEGAGRTLKGRDLRRVRNAVWHRTGFLD